MNNDLNFEQYKNIKPSNSFTHKPKIEMAIKSLLKNMFSTFNQKNYGDTVNTWTSRLTFDDMTLLEVQKGCDHAINTLDRIPSYRDFKRLVKPLYDVVVNDRVLCPKVEEAAKQLRHDTEIYTKQYLTKYTQEHLEINLKKWWIGVYGEGSNPENFDIPLKTFLPLFYQDLIKSKGNIEMAIEFGKEKNK